MTALNELLPALETLVLALLAYLALQELLQGSQFVAFRRAFLTAVLCAGMAWVILRGIELSPGSRYDARYSVMVSALLFLGPFPAVAVLVTGLVCRWYLGGIAAVSGMLGLSLTYLCTWALAWYFGWFQKPAPSRNKKLLVLGLCGVASSVMPLVAPLIVLPLSTVLERLLALGPAIVQVQLLGTLLFAGALLLQDERAAAVLARDEADAQLRAVLQAVPDVLLLQNKSGTCLEVLNEVPQAWGPRAGLKGKTLETVLGGAANATSQQAAVQAAIAESKLSHLVLRQIKSDSETVLDLRMRALDDQRVLTLVRDVTADHQLRYTLKTRSEQLGLLMENVRDLVGFVDGRGHLMPLSRACSSVLGYSGEDLASKPWTQFLDSRYAKQVEPYLAEVRKGRHKRVDFECVAVAQDGRRLWLDVQLCQLLDGERPEVRVLFAARDATERKKSQIKQQMAEHALHHLPDGVAVLDAATQTVEWVNDGFIRVSGYTETEALGSTLERLLVSIVPRDSSARPMPAKLQGRWQGELLSRRKDGTWFSEHRTVSTFDDELTQTSRLVVVMRDVSSERKQQQVLTTISRRDTLTSLPNRHRFLEALGANLQGLPETAAEGAPSGVAVFCLDLTQFKNLNTSLGREAGDVVLQNVALGLGTLLTSSNVLSRVESDEFALLLKFTDLSEVERMATRLLKFFHKPLRVQEQTVFLNANIGISIAHTSRQSAAIALHQSHLALESIAPQGEGLFGFYQEHLATLSQRSLAIETGLRRALMEAPQELTLEFQPKVVIATNVPLGFEALCRWTSSALGKVSPAEFIPVAEKTGLIRQLGSLVFERTCAQLAIWREQSLSVLPVAVNLSVHQLHDDALAEQLAGVAERYQVPAEMLELEVTESDLMSDVSKASRALADLRERGFRISLDDFGTGYSSMAYLQKLPLDVLKLDRSFVRPLGEDEESETICRTILTLAKNLGLYTVAEGVETEVQRNFLAEHGCDSFQGYLFAAPMSAVRAGDLLGSVKAAVSENTQHSLLM